MQRTIGVVTAERVAVGVVEQNQLVRPLRFFPERGSEADDLHGLAAEEISQLICEQIELALEGGEVSAVGIGFPGIIRNGIIEDSPNLHQVKGLNLQQAVAASLARRGINVPVVVSNDADVMAAGIAATQGYLDRVVRVWKLGQGIGFGLYPATDGVWEGGHTVVSLDPQERYCGCGGRGHLEGIMGYRAMRLRFPQHGAGGDFRDRQDRRSPVPRFRVALASCFGRRYRLQHPHGRSREVLHHRPQRPFRCPLAAESLHAGHGEDEPAARLRFRNCSWRR